MIVSDVAWAGQQFKLVAVGDVYCDVYCDVAQAGMVVHVDVSGMIEWQYNMPSCKLKSGDKYTCS